MGRPHHQDCTLGSCSSSERKWRHKAGQKTGPDRCFDQSAAQRVGHRHGCRCGHGLHQPGNAQQRIAAQFQGVAIGVVHAAQNDVDRQQAAQGFQINVIIAHGQVVAGHQRVAQVAGQVGVFEIGGAVRAGAQQHDPRILAMLQRQRAERVAQRHEKRRQPLHLAIVKHVRQHPRNDDPVLQRVARSRGHLRPIAQDLPHAVGRAGQMGRVQVQVGVPRNVHVVAGTQEAVVGKHQLGRHQPFVQQPLRAVKIGQNQVQQPCPLGQRGGQRLPLARGP